MLILVTLLCYGNILANSFVYDDDQQILQNPYLRSWRFCRNIYDHGLVVCRQAGATNYYRP